MLSALATLVFAIAAMAPGIVLCKGERLDTARLAALAIASLVVAMLVTALTGVALSSLTGAQLPSVALLPASLFLLVIAGWRSRGRHWGSLHIAWQTFVPIAFLLIYSAAIYAISITEMPNGDLRIHAWYNADWFKHIGHTFALAEYGVPARDIFGNGRPLHYYWLSYVLPGAGAGIGGDAWSALYTANMIYVALLAAVFFGVVRLTGASENISAFVATLATVISATPATWGALLQPGGVEALLSYSVPTEPAFISLALYIPQHALALSLLLAWAVLSLGEEVPPKRAHFLALGALISVMTISTLFGAAILATYGFTELYRRKFGAIPELALMAVLSVLAVLALGIVEIGNPAASAPVNDALVAGFADNGTLLQRSALSGLAPIARSGLPILVCLYLALRWKPATRMERSAKTFALALCGSAFLSAFLAEISLGGLIAHEMRLRMINLIAVAVAIIAGWAVWQAWDSEKKPKTFATITIAILFLAAAPTVIVRTLWHANARDGFTTIIPADDRAVLSALRARSTANDVVLQYPENTILAEDSGDDTWSVVLAGRKNLATQRATNKSLAADDVDIAKKFFSGENVPIPVSVDWIYLSRKLNPKGFEIAVSRLQGSLDWEVIECPPNACLFRRILAR